MRSNTQGGPNIITNDLIFHLDGANPYSLVSGATTWFNLKKYPTYDVNFFNDAKYVNTNKGSVRFDGVNDYANRIYVPGDIYDINLTGEITVDVWIKWDNILRASESVIALGRPFGNNTLSQYQWQFIKTFSGSNFRGIFAVSNSTQTYVLNQITNDGFFTPNTTIQNNKWYNFSYTYKFATGSMIGYVNGENAGGTIVGSNPSSLTTPAIGQRFLSIGAQSNPAGFFSMLGNIGIIKIYNRVLSPEEILQNFDAHKLRFGY